MVIYNWNPRNIQQKNIEQLDPLGNDSICAEISFSFIMSPLHSKSNASNEMLILFKTNAILSKIFMAYIWIA